MELEENLNNQNDPEQQKQSTGTAISDFIYHTARVTRTEGPGTDRHANKWYVAENEYTPQHLQSSDFEIDSNK